MTLLDLRANKPQLFKRRFFLFHAAGSFLMFSFDVAVRVSQLLVFRTEQYFLYGHVVCWLIGMEAQKEDIHPIEGSPIRGRARDRG